MKKIIALLFLSGLAHAGTRTLSFGPGGGTITISSGTAVVADTIVFDTATTSMNTTNANPCSWSITIGQGSAAADKVAVLACNALGATHVTSADIGGTSFVFQQATADSTAGGSGSEIWTAVNPPTGARTVTVNVAGGDCGGVGSMTCTVADFTGVKQSAPVNVSTGAYADSAQTVTATRSTTINNDFIVSSGGNGYSGVTMSDGSSQTVLINVNNTVNGYNSAQAYKGPITPLGSTAITWNAVGGINSVMTMTWIALQPGP
jgi:hypothetical protein